MQNPSQVRKVLLAFDTFKDTISSESLTELTESTLKELNPCLEVYKVPMSDGGEGFLKAMQSALSQKGFYVERKFLEVLSPVGVPVKVTFT